MLTCPAISAYPAILFYIHTAVVLYPAMLLYRCVILKNKALGVTVLTRSTTRTEKKGRLRLNVSETLSAIRLLLRDCTFDIRTQKGEYHPVREEYKTSFPRCSSNDQHESSKARLDSACFSHDKVD